MVFVAAVVVDIVVVIVVVVVYIFSSREFLLQVKSKDEYHY
jgi:hypothetical protein